MTIGLAEVNAMDRDTFVATVGPTFERAPWIAGQAWSARPFANAAALHAAMLDVIDGAPPEQRIAFLCGHPDLAGKEAAEGSMTIESVGEQASAGLDALTSDEATAIRHGNDTYRERHGFPFIIAVRRHTKSQILDAMKHRLDRETPIELDEAMRQIAFITQGRIEALLTPRGSA